MHTVLTTSPITVAGTYLVTASFTVAVNNDYVGCAIADGANSVDDVAGPSSSLAYQNMSVEDTVIATVGQQLTVECHDYNTDPSTYFVAGTIGAIPIAPATGSTGASDVAPASRHVTPARLAS